jgi:uncharacterized protein (TIGR00730 family)
MEAANRGAYEAGGKTIGLNIRLPFEQAPNPYITPSLNFEFHYFFMRKYWFAYLAKALVVFPGGFGTLDEMFEVLTLVQTEKLAKKISIVVYGSAYWNSILNLDVLVDKGAISAQDRALFQMADTPEEAFEILKSDLTRYHLEPEARRQAPPNVEEEPLLNPGHYRHAISARFASQPQRLRLEAAGPSIRRETPSRFTPNLDINSPPSNSPFMSCTTYWAHESDHTVTVWQQGPGAVAPGWRKR